MSVHMLHHRTVSLFVLGVLLSAVLSSCGPSEAAMREEIDTGMKSWVGKSETELVAKWGAPSRSYKTMDGSRELTWIYSRTSSSPGYVWYDYWGRAHYSHPRKHESKLERSFTIAADGIVTHYHWAGY
jgi:hypothetical protein